MIHVSPRAQFQLNTEWKEAWAQIVASPAFKAAVVHSQAQMVASGLMPESLAGVNGFLFVLCNIHQELPEVSPLPSKPLKSYDNPIPPPKPQPKP